ncbi:EAL domain-containing protein [Bacillus dakarensis]|uniref:EAL domain-containing protein n=1 Tax=Robertmurraya dakarensis TaxID=1926278 RepID=UPI00098174DE|nr:EAL domain-containing protein [Bacillus dakarensis]
MNLLKQYTWKNLYSEYQPLMNSSNDQIFAYEALMRSSPKINPLAMIEYARHQEVLYELDTICIQNAITEYPFSYYHSHYLFINIFPSTIVHDDFKNFIGSLLKKFPHIRERIVFEVNEDVNEVHIWTREDFSRRILELKSYGFRIAFDDMPIARLSFERMYTLTPDFVKLDHTKSKDLSTSLEKQQLISLFLEFTDEKMRLVLEGIETEQDLLTAKQLGVPLLQGYYISKPKRLEF